MFVSADVAAVPQFKETGAKLLEEASGDAAKKARDRQPPPWQEPGLPQPNDAKGGYESDSARDRARELHQGEMGLKAIEADVAGRDQRKQGKRDSR